MHSGRSPGPRTPEGLPRRGPGARIRVRDARTIHGSYGANARADNCHGLTLLRISWVDIALDRYQANMPPASSANRPPQRAPTPSPTVPSKPSSNDPLNREPTAKTGATAPRVAGSNASSAAATVQPASAHAPAPRPVQSGEGSKVRAAPCLASFTRLHPQRRRNALRV